jgi:hypothetical protein
MGRDFSGKVRTVIRIPDKNCVLQFLSVGCGESVVSPQPLEMRRIAARHPVAHSNAK